MQIISGKEELQGFFFDANFFEKFLTKVICSGIINLSNVERYTRGRSMANLIDVAKKAGVSKTLVSRVINNQKGVSEESRAKILKAMKELNYIPNGTARALVTGRTAMIGIILDSLCEPYFFELIKGIEAEIARSNYHVIFCSGENSAQIKEQYIDLFASGRTDGVIIYGSNYDDVELIKRISKSNFPIAVIENVIDDENVNNVIVENGYGSKMIVEHLYEIGCRDILHITGTKFSKVALERKLGYEDAMKCFGLKAYTLDCEDFKLSRGYAVVKEYLETHGTEELPDAIYFGADVLAYGGIMALQDAGISVPKDIKIAGFDDDNPLHYDVERKLPALTTIRQPLFNLGVETVKLMINQIENTITKREKRSFYPELVIRESTKIT